MSLIHAATMMPPDLRNHLPEPQTPWKISPDLYARLCQQPYEGGGIQYKKCQILSKDPEHRLILEYFHHQKPPQYGIANIYCLYTPSLTKQFESTIETIDQKAQTFPPEWDKEDSQAERDQAMKRWKTQASQFYPLSIQRPTRKDTYFHTRILPLWHGTSGSVCHSIASSGFTYFGKHHFFHLDAKPGQFKSTDRGYFGSGIYFTNSAKYASMYNSGHLLLAWVSMKEPFPVVNDVPHPQQGQDMKKLCGQGAYQTYNAHYIPVAPISQDPSCMEYYPCYKNQPPACDEFVVFQESQTLPRFWIELQAELLKSPPVATICHLSKQILHLLGQETVQSDPQLYQLLKQKSDSLSKLHSNDPLTPSDQEFYESAIQLVDTNVKVKAYIYKKLQDIPNPALAQAKVWIQEAAQLYRKGAWNEALEQCLRALVLQQKECGDLSIDVTETLFLVGQCYEMEPQHAQDALGYYQQVSERLKASHPQGHPLFKRCTAAIRRLSR